MRNSIKKYKLFAIFILFTSFSINLIASTATTAYSPKDITKKAVMQNLKYCYDNDGITEKFNSIGDYKGKDSLYKSNVGGDELPLPSSSNGAYHDLGDNTVRCQDLVKGYDTAAGGKIEDAFTMMGHPAPASGSSDTGTWLTTYAGYKQEAGSAGEKGGCVKFWFKYTHKTPLTNEVTEDKSTDQICVDKLSSGGKIDSEPYLKSDGGWRSVKFKVAGGYDQTTKALMVQNGNVQILKSFGGYGVPNWREISYSGKTWDAFVSEIVAEVPNSLLIYNENECRNARSTNCADHKTTFDRSEKFEGEEAGQSSASYSLDSNAGDKVVKALTNDSYTYVVSDQEQVHLYMYYFATLLGTEVTCGITAEQASGNGYDGPIKWFKSGEKTVSSDCYVTKKGKTGENLNGLTSYNGGTFKFKSTNYDDLYNYFKTLAITELDDPSGSTTGEPETEDGDTEGEERDPDCHTKGGALGWIVCPIIEQSTDMIQNVYTDWIQPYLSIDAVLFDTSETGGQAIHQIWSLFQGFANLAFVILFLVVIFSQLTGVGIDNYGIKKILPKLIIGAVLINMSYIICQLAVDISNILGRAIASMFQQFASEINNKLTGVSVNLYPDQVQNPVEGQFATIGNDNGNGTIVLVIVLIVGLLGLGIFLAAGPAFFIPVLLAVISVAIGMFFLFALLALRQAVAVILVVVSPMAFAAYMLPNTKKIFDKWSQAFKGMLIAYPIASALVFGGDLVSKILLVASGSTTITSLGLLLSAAVVAIAPIFFIPSVIRKSMGALSGIANVLQNGQQKATKRLGEGASNRIKNSGIQRTINQRNERRRAGINSKGKLTTRGKLQNILPRFAGGRANLAEARQQALGYVSADNTNRRMLTTAGVAAASAGITAKAAQQEVNDEITNMAKDTKNYNVDVMESELAGYLAQDSLSPKNETRVKALMTKLSQSGGDGNKRLINLMSGKNGNNVSDAGKKLFAKYATNTDIANSMGNKDAYMAQYLRDTQAGYTNKSFKEWLDETNTNGRGEGVSNAQFVATKQLDDDERLMQQSGDSLERTVNGGWVRQDRAQRILDNDNINKKQDQIDKLEKTGARMQTKVNANDSDTSNGSGADNGSGSGTGSGSGSGGSDPNPPHNHGEGSGRNAT